MDIEKILEHLEEALTSLGLARDYCHTKSPLLKEIEDIVIDVDSLIEEIEDGDYEVFT